MNTVTASAKNIRISTRKVRLVADTVRDMMAEDAIKKLTFVNKHGVGPIVKVIKSAMANAVNNKKLSASTLMIQKLTVDEAPFLKRFRIGSRSRVKGYKKRGSHITVVLAEKEEKGASK